MSVFRAADAWHRRLGPLDATAAMVVGGQLQMPKPRFAFRPSARPNHPSWEHDEAAKTALGPKFATWAWQGIVEMVPRNCPLPLFIEPLGAVDKATDPFYRLILDARISNEYQDPWGVWNLSSQLAAMLDVCDIMFAEDEDAYHLSIFAGCTGKPFWSRTFAVDENGCVVERWRLVMGCDPYSCLGLCDKAMSGFSVGGFVGRFAAAHFGQRNAGSPLNVLMRCIQRFLARRILKQAPRPHSRRAQGPGAPPALTGATATPRRGLGPAALHSAVWVDDAVYITKTPPHPPCPGLAAACPTCAKSARSATRSQAGWHRLSAELGHGLSTEKRQTPSQRVTYTGMTIDTLHRTISVPLEKKLRLAECLESFFGLRESTITELASLRGRVHLLRGPSVRAAVCRPFSSVIGTPETPDYDSRITLPPAVSDAAVFIRDVFEEFAEIGPLWPFVPSSLHAAFLAGEKGSAHVAVITWDASLHAWGMVLRWWNNKKGVVIIGTLPDTEDMKHQVRREAYAGVQAYEAAARVLNANVILRNDAIGALTSLRKGCFSSTFLQQCVMTMCHLQRHIRSNTIYLHAPGHVLVEEGVDDHSRAGALDVARPANSSLVRDQSLKLAKACGWTLMVDAFASKSNRLLPRFFARYAEPDAEAEKAFTVPDRARIACPSCGRCHRETLFAFPPPPLLNAFVAEARADGARAIVITHRRRRPVLEQAAARLCGTERGRLPPHPASLHRLRRCRRTGYLRHFRR